MDAENIPKCYVQVAFFSFFLGRCEHELHVPVIRSSACDTGDTGHLTLFSTVGVPILAL